MSTDLSLFFFSSNLKTLVHWMDCTELNLHQDPHKLQQQNLGTLSSRPLSIINSRLGFGVFLKPLKVRRDYFGNTGPEIRNQMSQTSERPTLNSPAEMSKMVKHMFPMNLNVIIWFMGNWITNGNWTHLKSVEWLDFWLLVDRSGWFSWLVGWSCWNGVVVGWFCVVGLAVGSFGG